MKPLIDWRIFQSWLPYPLRQPQAQQPLKLAIILGVFFLSLVVAIRPTSRLTLLILAALIAVAAAMILLRNLALGLVGVIVASLLMPAFLGTGGMAATLSPPILLLVMVIGLWFLDMLTRRRKISLLPSRTLLPALLFLVVILIAFVNGQINYYLFAQVAPLSAQIGGLAVFLLSVGSFLAAGNLVRDLKWLKALAWVFVGLGCVYIFSRLFYQIGRFILPLFQYGADASIFWVWLVAISASQAFFNRQLARPWRLALLGVTAATLYVALAQAYSWKSGWLPPLIALFVIVWVAIPRFRIPGLFLLAGAVIFNASDRLGSLVAGGEDYSIMTRVVAWAIVLEIVKVNPILGLGMSNYYWYTPLFPILGYRVQFNSHNNYVDIIAQTGLIGLAMFSWFMFEIGRLGWGLLHRVPEGFARAYVIGALGGLAGTLVSGMLGDWVIPFVYNVGLVGFRSSLIGWLFLGGLVALEGMYSPLGGRQVVEAE